MLKRWIQRITHFGCKQLLLKTKTNAAQLSLGFECLKQAESRKTVISPSGPQNNSVAVKTRIKPSYKPA